MANKDFYFKPRDTGSNSPISERRLALGLTQEQLAEKAGVNLRQISAWERGAIVPSGKSLVKLSKALDCTIDELMNP